MEQIQHTQEVQDVAPIALDECIATCRREHNMMAGIDREVQALRENRQQLLERMAQAQVRRDEIRQGRVDGLVRGEQSQKATDDEYRELGELIADGQLAINQSEQQERRFILPLYEAHKAVVISRQAVERCYAKVLDAEAQGILKALRPHLEKLAAITNTKGRVIGVGMAYDWVNGELMGAFRQELGSDMLEYADENEAAMALLAMDITPSAADLFDLCDTPGKMQRFRREMSA
ncbi:MULTISPECIES: hypothetical protein [Aeromonas]|uniref:hypothetical protein n=1 Tax=Aeromonas TaxID=642 RepID=UPI0022DEB2DF|nr:hypothetical protein [Aeromonas sp. Y318-1]